MKDEPFDFDAYSGKKTAVTRRPATAKASDPPIVKEIMTEIGLGFEPSWYDGPSCLLCRRQALRRLVRSLKRHHDADNRVAAPVAKLFQQAVEVVRFEERNTPYRLHRTWQAMHQLILVHLAIATTRSNSTRALAVDDAQRRVRKIMDEPATDEERRKAAEQASHIGPDGSDADERRRER